MIPPFSDGGPVPSTPAAFAAEVQALALDQRFTSGAELDTMLGQLTIAYADTLIPGGIQLRYGPWPGPCGCGDVEVPDGEMELIRGDRCHRRTSCYSIQPLSDPIEHTHIRKVEK